MSASPLRVSELSDARPDDRIFLKGPETLANEELLAVVLGTRRFPESLALSRDLLADGLEAFRRRSFANRAEALRLGRRRAAVLSSFLELARRLHTLPPTDRPLLGTPERIAAYLRPKVGDHAVERVGALLLDGRYRLLFDREILSGSLESANIHPRDVLRRCLAEDASAFVVYHNHPSGDPTPSRDDIDFTRALAAASRTVGIKFLDHVVVGREGCVSLSQRGLM